MVELHHSIKIYVQLQKALEHTKMKVFLIQMAILKEIIIY
jgi:hypothetical protein